jgi:hypothetical protein
LHCLEASPSCDHGGGGQVVEKPWRHISKFCIE